MATSHLQKLKVGINSMLSKINTKKEILKETQSLKSNLAQQLS